MSAATGPQPVWFRVRSALVRQWCAVREITYGSVTTYCNGRVPASEDIEVGTPSDLERCSLCRSRVALKTAFPRVQCSQLAPVEERVVELQLEDFSDEADTKDHVYPVGADMGADG